MGRVLGPVDQGLRMARAAVGAVAGLGVFLTCMCAVALFFLLHLVTKEAPELLYVATAAAAFVAVGAIIGWNRA